MALKKKGGSYVQPERSVMSAFWLVKIFNMKVSVM